MALVWIAFWGLCCVLGALFLDERAIEINLYRALQLGFDPYGRNLAWMTLKGSGLTLLFASLATLVSVVAGLLIGSLLAVLPRALQRPGLAALNLILAFPYLLFALAIAVIRGPGWGTLFLVLLLSNTPYLIRFVFLRAKELQIEDFAQASLAIGATRIHLVLRHLMPSTMSLVWVKVPSLFAQALLAEASLSFLGLGVPVGTISWGSLLAMSKDFLLEAPHIAIFTGLPLTFSILSLQIISEANE